LEEGLASSYELPFVYVDGLEVAALEGSHFNVSGGPNLAHIPVVEEGVFSEGGGDGETKLFWGWARVAAATRYPHKQEAYCPRCSAKALPARRHSLQR